MPTLMPTDTRNALGQNTEKCDSRSLLLDRYVDPTAEKDERKHVFTRAFTKKAVRAKADGWAPFLTGTLGLTAADLLFGKLQSRLMVNMAGGVMENAGLCLDRFGVPYIPGSAIKGCARRVALAALHEWCAASGQTQSKPDGQGNPIALCWEKFSSPAEMLAAIARIFGWCELDWSSRSGQSDFRWACAGNEPTLKAAAEILVAHFHWPIEDRHRDTPWLSLPNFAGSVSFLPAYPVQAPNPDLELDVVTCHHKQYYAEPVEPKDVTHSHKKWQRWKRDHDAWEKEWGNAPDTEEPVPVVFPAVAPGHVFVFALVPLRHGDAALLQQARDWLKAGLETFGLGAKTNAGYGWFNCSEAFQESVRQEVERQQTELRIKLAQAEAERKAREEAEAKARAEQERLANAPPHERFRTEYVKLADEPFAAQAKKFAEMTEDQRHGFVLALKEKRETAKRWAKKKPDLIKPWQEFAKKLQTPVELP